MSEKKKVTFMENSHKKYFLEISHCSLRTVMWMAVRNNEGRHRSELISSLENYEELAATENEIDWAFPFYATDTSHVVWLRWFRLCTESVLARIRLFIITCIVHVWVSKNESGREKDCEHICIVNTTLSSHHFCSLSKYWSYN